MTLHDLLEGLVLLASIGFYLEACKRRRQANLFKHHTEEMWAAAVAIKREAHEYRMECIEAALKMGASTTEAETKMPARKSHLKLVE